MTQPNPNYVELKSIGSSPTTLESSVELKVPAKVERTNYVLYNSLASLGFIISITSLIFYLAFNFSGLIIAFSALGTITVGAGCFFSYLAISRVDPKKQSYAFTAFCLAAVLCFATSIISLNLVFQGPQTIPNLAFSSTEFVHSHPMMPVPPPETQPVVTSPPKAISEPVIVQTIEPAFVPSREPTDGGKTDYIDPNTPVSSSNADTVSISADQKMAASQAYHLPYTKPGVNVDYMPYPQVPVIGNSYTYSSSYSNSYTYSYSDPYPYSISYSYTYSNSDSTVYGSSYSVSITSNYDNYSPYGQPSYSNSYSYSGSANSNGNTGIPIPPDVPMPANASIPEPYEDTNSTSKNISLGTPDPTTEVEVDSIPFDEPTHNVDDFNTNSDTSKFPPVSTIAPSKPVPDMSTSSTSDNVTQNLVDPIPVVPGEAYTSYFPYASGGSTGSGSSTNAGYPGEIPSMPNMPTINPDYTSYSSWTSSSNSYTYTYSDPYPYAISYSYTYSTSDSTEGSSYSIWSSSNYDNYSPYGQPSYSNSYSYSGSTNKNGNSYTYPNIRPLYAKGGYEAAPPSYAYTTYEPVYNNYNTAGQEETSPYSTDSGYATDAPAYATPAFATPASPEARFYNANKVNESGASPVMVTLSVLLFAIKAILFVALITQAHELKNVLKQRKQAALEESAIKSEFQIV